MRVRHKPPRNKKTIYVVGFWARYGVVKFSLEKFKKGVPYVWHYEDYNGTASVWECSPIDYAILNPIVWTMNRGTAEEIAEGLNELQHK